MVIKSVKFIISSPDLKSCPPEGPAEYAFAGRSNVGKSSLLNLLSNEKNLAKTSSLPGKTRLINYFMVNDSWFLVDLPGYGYANTGKQNRDAYLSAIREYLLYRKTLACLFVLVDCRHKPLENDVSFIQWAGSHEIPVALVFTKSDKLSQMVLMRNIDIYKETLLQDWETLPPVFIVSSHQSKGKEEILEFIQKSNTLFNAG
jgi:GTP-binding protein